MRELRVAVLEDEQEGYINEILRMVNIHGYKIYSIEEITEKIKAEYLLHYQGSRRIAIRKDSAIGLKLLNEIRTHG